MNEDTLSLRAKTALVKEIDSVVEESEDPFLSRTLLLIIAKNKTSTYLSTIAGLNVDRSVVKNELKRLSDSGLINITNEGESYEGYWPKDDAETYYAETTLRDFNLFPKITSISSEEVNNLFSSIKNDFVFSYAKSFEIFKKDFVELEKNINNHLKVITDEEKAYLQKHLGITQDFELDLGFVDRNDIWKSGYITGGLEKKTVGAFIKYPSLSDALSDGVSKIGGFMINQDDYSLLEEKNKNSTGVSPLHVTITQKNSNSPTDKYELCLETSRLGFGFRELLLAPLSYQKQVIQRANSIIDILSYSRGKYDNNNIKE